MRMLGASVRSNRGSYNKLTHSWTFHTVPTINRTHPSNTKYTGVLYMTPMFCIRRSSVVQCTYAPIRRLIILWRATIRDYHRRANRMELWFISSYNNYLFTMYFYPIFLVVFVSREIDRELLCSLHNFFAYVLFCLSIVSTGNIKHRSWF